MKYTKKYFNTTRLNKGYSHKDERREDDISIIKKKYQHILPPIDVVTEYENLYPGTLEKIIKMAQKDQENQRELAEKEIDRKYKNGLILRILSLIGIIFVVVCIFPALLFMPMIVGGFAGVNNTLITMFGIVPFVCCVFFMLGVILPRWFWQNKRTNKVNYKHHNNNYNNNHRQTNNGRFKK